MTKIYYLAHPYSPQDGSAIYSPAGREQVQLNVDRSIEITNDLLDRGYLIFNPLTHSHPLDEHKNRVSQFWYDLDIILLNKFDGIMMSPGWTESKGCKKEFLHAIEMIKKGIIHQFILY